MDKLSMCRICLVENVNMYVVVNKNLRELYEKLTDIPFVTTDSRPNLACFFCCAKLKQCFRLLRKCLEAEELFAQMMNDDFEPNPSIRQDDLHSCTGFITSPIVHVSVFDECETDSIVIKEEVPAVCEGQDDVIKSPIVHVSVFDECQTDSIAIKEEVPAICEGQDDVIEPKEEYLSDDLHLENLNNTCLGIEDIPPHLSESNSGGDVKIKVEEEQELPKKKRRAVETNRAPVTKKPKLDTRRTSLEDTIAAELKKNEQSNLLVIRTTKKFSVKESYKCDQRSLNRVKKIKQYTCGVCHGSFSRMSGLRKHIRIHTGEKPYKCDTCQRSFTLKDTLITHIQTHTGEKPHQCDVCQRSFSKKADLRKHNRTHTGEKPFKCQVCQRSFSEKGHLTAHNRIHTGEKPYQCNLCQRSFSKKCILTKHIRIHTGEKPFKCEVCQRSFREKAHLTTHIRRHTGEKPYKCDVCQRKYRQRNGLIKHIRGHTGETLQK